MQLDNISNKFCSTRYLRGPNSFGPIAACLKFIACFGSIARPKITLCLGVLKIDCFVVR